MPRWNYHGGSGARYFLGDFICKNRNHLQDYEMMITFRHTNRYLCPIHCTVCHLWDMKFITGTNHTFRTPVNNLHFPFYQFSRCNFPKSVLTSVYQQPCSSLLICDVTLTGNWFLTFQSAVSSSRLISAWTGKS